MRIYTRTGDDGTTGLIGGGRVDKDDLAIEVFGALDELNCAVGLARVHGSGWPLDMLLERVQRLIFEVGSEIASPVGHKQSQTANLGTVVSDLERSIDLQVKMLPQLQHFVLPGGCELAARLHVARVLCRRAERRLVGLGKSKDVRPELIEFVNRLSDWLFVAARTANHEFGADEPVWIKED